MLEIRMVIPVIFKPASRHRNIDTDIEISHQD